ncbi:nucleotide exchange factor GrpE [Psittacicella gerlachiana]|uniref:Protein GrpE n=1 Tax=Psittacicella gerlachiana TaxID=2028574 RepID=A0A3A1YGN9_9GAMM|nr:nucleotide exchange factor GrpE [Psittacicella gerlachiana]RIY36429.1 nucleotide exchange factor GrpE [Psittacicella gerlachiana]
MSQQNKETEFENVDLNQQEEQATQAQTETETQAQTEAQTEQQEATTEQAETTEASTEAEVVPFVLSEQLNHDGEVSKEAVDYLKQLLTYFNEAGEFVASEDYTEENLVQDLDSLSQLATKQLETVQSSLSSDSFEKLTQRLEAINSAQEEENRRLEREKKETENAVLYANEKIIKNAIKPLFQNLNMALNQLPKETGNKDFEQFVLELKEFEQNLKASLAKEGVEIYGAKGEVFDPNIHDAVAIFTGTPEQAGTIFDVVSQGYKLKDRVVSPASVVAYAPEE